ncbi:MAG: hypothetical protein CVV05_05845 [Gammaproteobacteria bacterium HGW-Gammaproteobacteria-1]|jgi:hypothetical protein|nr:MAG: hypothetical protein CVV05_05845 [Gammaproteobacteria bacterium HGW-Gammaproteobacteria-1]
MFIASLGWDHAGWCGSFYPDDLPPEWRLAYYANEFRAVVVPAALWRGADAGTAAQWATDTAEGFRFLLEAAAGAPPAALVQALGERYGGTAGPGGRAVARWEGGADARALRGLIEGLPADGVLLVAGEPPSLAALRAAQTLTQLMGV